MQKFNGVSESGVNAEGAAESLRRYPALDPDTGLRIR